MKSCLSVHVSGARRVICLQNLNKNNSMRTRMSSEVKATCSVKASISLSDAEHHMRDKPAPEAYIIHQNTQKTAKKKYSYDTVTNFFHLSQVNFACAKVDSIISHRKIKTATCLLEILPIWLSIMAGSKMKRWLTEIMLGNEGKANDVNHEYSLAVPDWLYNGNQTTLSQTRLGAQHCHLGQWTSRETLAEWACLFNLPTVQPARQSTEAETDRERWEFEEDIMVIAGRVWMSRHFEKIKKGAWKGGREVCFKRNNDVSALNNVDSKTEAVLWPFKAVAFVLVFPVLCFLVRKLWQL